MLIIESNLIISAECLFIPLSSGNIIVTHYLTEVGCSLCNQRLYILERSYKYGMSDFLSECISTTVSKVVGPDFIFGLDTALFLFISPSGMTLRTTFYTAWILATGM
jgi:hypothetical protein